MKGIKFLSILVLMLALVLVTACGSVSNNGSDDSKINQHLKMGLKLNMLKEQQKFLNILNVWSFLNTRL